MMRFRFHSPVVSAEGTETGLPGRSIGERERRGVGITEEEGDEGGEVGEVGGGGGGDVGASGGRWACPVRNTE